MFKGWFLAMVLFPDVQKAAQEEIDRVVGSDRLPAYSDRPYLPYVNAMTKEAFRWHTVGPVGELSWHLLDKNRVY